ncbi:hypothetical protein ACFLUR_03880 [Chloroflexota bacterium]
MSKFPLLIIGASLIFLTLFPTSCTDSDNDTMNENEKISSQLYTQISLRKEQIANPAPDRLEIMKNMGMSVDNMEIQRIFIHLAQELNPSQIEEIETMGITLYLDSWIPPVGDHPTGFLTADIPIDRLEELTEKDYVIRLETAEHQLQPQIGAKPQQE